MTCHPRPCGPGSYAVFRADGTSGVYDSRDWTYRENAGQEARQRDPAGVVPMYCLSCFGTDAPSSRDLLGALPSDCCLAVAGVAHYRAPDGDTPRLSASEYPGDIGPAQIEPYYLHGGDCQVVQPQPGRLCYNHSISAGRVIAYWHAHGTDGGTYLCALAAVTSPDVGEAVVRYLADRTNSVALSLGTYEFGRNELVAELSVVLVPGRVGCFAGVGPPGELSPGFLADLGFPAGRGDPPRSLSWSLPNPPTREEVLEATLVMVSAQRDILKLSRTHPCKSNAEKYINHSIGRYSQLTGKQPRLLMASLPSLGNEAGPSSAANVTQRLAELGFQWLSRRQQQQQARPSRAETGRDRSRSPIKRGKTRRVVFVSSDSESEEERTPTKRARGRRTAEQQRLEERRAIIEELKEFLGSTAEKAPPAKQPEKADPGAELRSLIDELKGDIREMKTKQESDSRQLREELERKRRAAEEEKPKDPKTINAGLGEAESGKPPDVPITQLLSELVTIKQ